MAFLGGDDSEALKKLKKQLAQQELQNAQLVANNARHTSELAELRESARSLDARLAAEVARTEQLQSQLERSDAERGRQSLHIVNLQQALDAAQRQGLEGEKGRKRDEMQRCREWELQQRDAEEEKRNLNERIRTLESQLAAKKQELMRASETSHNGNRGRAADPVARAVALENELISLRTENERLSRSISEAGSGVAGVGSSQAAHSLFSSSTSSTAAGAPRSHARPRRSSISSSAPTRIGAGGTSGREALDAELVALRGSLDEAHAQHASLEAKCARAEREALKVSNEAMAKERAQERELDSLRHEVSELREEMRWKEEELQGLRAELDQQQQQQRADTRRQGADGQNAAAEREQRQRYAALSEELASAQRAASDASAELGAVQARCTELEKRLQDTEVELARQAVPPPSSSGATDVVAPATSESRAVRELRRELNAVQAERDALRTDVAQLEDEVEKLQAAAGPGGGGGGVEGNSAAVLRQRAEAMQAEVEELKERLAEALERQQQSEAREREVASEEKALQAELEAMRKDHAELASQAEAARSSVAQLEAQLSDARVAAEARDTSATSRAEQEARVEALEVELETTRAAASALRVDVERAATELAEAREAAARVESLETELRAAQAEVEVASRAAAEVELLRGETERLQLEVWGAGKSAEEARAELERTRAELVDARRELEEALSTSADTSANERAEQLQARLDVARHELGRKERDFDEVQEIAEGLGAELQQRVDELAAARQRLHEQALELDVLRTDVARTSPEEERRADLLHAQLSARDAQLRDALEALGKREAEVATAKRQLSSLASRVGRAFGPDAAAGAGGLGGDTSILSMNGNEGDETCLPAASPVKQGAGGGGGTAAATSRRGSLSFSAGLGAMSDEAGDLLESVANVRERVREAERRLEFLHVEASFQRQELESRLQEVQQQQQQQDDSSDTNRLASIIATLEKLREKQAALKGLETRGSFRAVHAERIAWLEKHHAYQTKQLASLSSLAMPIGASSDGPNGAPAATGGAGLVARVAELEARVLRRTEQVGLHQRELEKERTNLRLAEEAAEEASAEVERLVAKGTELEALLEAATSTAQRAETKCAALQARVDEVEAGRASGQTEGVASGNELREATSQTSQPLEDQEAERERDEKKLVSTLREQLDAQAREAAEANFLVENLEARLKRADEQRRALGERLAELEAETTRAAEDEAVARQEAESMRQRLAEAEAERDTAISMGEQRQRRVESLLEEASSAREAARDELVMRLERERDESESRRADAELRCEALRLELADTERRAQDAAHKQAEVAKELAELREGAQRQAEEEAERNTRERAALSVELDEARRAHQEAQACIEELQGAARTQADAAQRAQALEAEVGELRVQLETAQHELRETAHTAKAQENAQRSQVASLEESLDAARSELVRMDDVVRRLEERDAQVSELEGALAHREEQLRSRNDEYWSLKEELGELQEHVERSREVRQTVEALEEKLREATVERDAARRLAATAKDEAQREREEQREAAAVLTQRCEELEAKVEDMRKRADASGRAAEEAKKRLASLEQMERQERLLREEMASYRARLAETSANERKLVEQLANVQAQRSVAGGGGDADEDVEVLQMRIRDLEEELQSKVQELEDNDSKILLYLKESKKLAARNKSLQAKLDALGEGPSGSRVANSGPSPSSAATVPNGATPSTRDVVGRSTSESRLPSSRKRALPDEGEEAGGGPSTASAVASVDAVVQPASTHSQQTVGAAVPSTTARPVYQPVHAASVATSPSRSFTPVRRNKMGSAGDGSIRVLGLGARPDSASASGQGTARSTSNPSELVAERLSASPAKRGGSGGGTGGVVPSALSDRSNARVAGGTVGIGGAAASDKPQASDLMARLAKYRSSGAVGATHAATTGRAR